jgi:hypothetical protein
VKKFIKRTIILSIIVGVIWSIFTYNTRPLTFEDNTSQSTPVEDYIKDKTDRIGEAAAGIEMPDFSKAWEDTKKNADDFINESSSSDNTGTATGEKYNRAEHFGDGWQDPDKNGCDARNDVLARDLVKITVNNDCTVQTGVLEDKYSGTTIQHVRGKSKIDIDHVIALSLAYKYGADEWSQSKREAFANDPMNLMASSASENRSKGDSSPAEWMPSNEAFHCEYAQQVEKVAVKYDVNLPKADLAVIANSCS